MPRPMDTPSRLHLKKNNPCPLCGREMVPGPSVDLHHLIPKSKKGKDTVYIHKICHRKVHSVFTEKELEKEWNTIEKLKSNPEISKFVKWVSKKDPEFLDSSRDHKRKRR